MTSSFTIQTIDRIDFASWLPAQEIFPKFFWKCRKTGVETVALGSLMEFSKIPTTFPCTSKVYGAISFSEPVKGSCWKDFPSSFFFLPEVEIIQTSEKTTLKTRGCVPCFKKPLSLDETPLFLEPQNHFPSFEGWQSSISEALTQIKNGFLHKVVLARKSTFSTSSSPFAWLKTLLASAHNSTVFALQKNENSLFLGATPEMLYQRNGRIIQTESIAGTRKGADDFEKDLLIQQELQHSLKDNREFAFVKDFLQNTLASICQSYEIDEENSLLQTSTLHHLYCRLEGLLNSDVTDSMLVSLLHPTPAIGGHPKNKAVDQILSLEPFDRGLYSGVLGWVSPAEASFAVAIRSALIQQGLLHAFAGTGIVEGSTPEKEWIELEHKISHWKNSCLIHH